MKQTARRILFASVLTISVAGCRSAGGITQPEDVTALLKSQTQELMDAVAPGHAEVWQRYLHKDVVYLDENGDVFDKERLIRELTPLPAGLVGRIEVDKFQVSRHGDTAIAVGELQEYLDYHGQNLRTRFRFLDTWLRTPDGWRLAARHTAAVLKDPPAVSLSSAELCAYAGVYELTPDIVTTVSCTKDALTSERSGRPATTYLPEVRDVFFAAGQPRSRRIFIRDAAGHVVAFVDRREGEDVRWKRR